MSGRVLFVDDEEVVTKSLIRGLQRCGATFECFSATNRDAALSTTSSAVPDVAVIDLSLDPVRGPESGLELISDLMQTYANIRILVLTGHGADEFGIQALHRGASSFLTKPVNPNHLLPLINDAISYSQLRTSHQKLGSEKLAKRLGISSKNEKMLQVLEQATYAASSPQPVLIIGETGTGKGVLAQAIHKASARSAKAFIRYQPSFGNQDLVSSELFGHERGAFTGANERKQGLLEVANKGTLFIDEIDELPQETQIQLLNVLQEKVYRRLGSTKDITSDFRLIAATNADIKEALQTKKIREDFYHRVAHLTLEIPPLRKRKEDIPDLAEGMLLSLANREDLPVHGFSPEAIGLLVSQDWPGNVRQLQATVEGAIHRAHFYERTIVMGEDIGTFDDASTKRGLNGHQSFRERVQRYEKELIEEALEQYEGNQSKAAATLQLDRSTLRRILSRSD